MRLHEFMSTAVQSASPDETAAVAWNRMRAHAIRHLVVVAGGAVVGVLSERDLGGERGVAIRRGRSVQDLMARSPVVASPRTTVREAANLMRGHTIGSLPVVDDGKLVGIVTITDLLDLIGRGVERPSTRVERPVLRGRGPVRRPRTMPALRR